MVALNHFILFVSFYYNGYVKKNYEIPPFSS